MSKDTFTFLCEKLRPAVEREDTSFRHCVPLKKRVAIALRKVATGSEYQTIAKLFGVSCTTVCRCVQDFCAAAKKFLVPEQIRIPDKGRCRETESGWALPQCVGAIGSYHVRIVAPQYSHTDYCNREGLHSIILQGVVDGRGKFWNVFAGLAGSLHNTEVLRLSHVWELASQGNLLPAHTRTIGTVSVGYYILGDLSYPLQDWLLTPFHDTGQLTAQQHTFNQKVSQARLVVEEAFGRLKGRWRFLVKRNICDINLLKSMLLTCCALHNLCEDRGDGFESSWDVCEPMPPEPCVAVPQAAQEDGRDIRDALMQYLVPSF